MDIVILTGAASEPAQSIARRLVSAGLRVYGFDSHFFDQGFQHKDFIPVPLNLADPAAVLAAATKILTNETLLAGVILAGHHPLPDPLESAHTEDILFSLNADLAAPLLLTRATLPTLIRRRSHLIAITHDAPEFPANALTATITGALRSLTHALFEELRDTGVKTSHLHIASNPPPHDPAARLTHAPQSQVQPDIVADVVETLLRLRENNALTELVLRPQATREEPRIPISSEPRLRAIQVIQLPPPQNLPPPEEPIPTPTRKRPDYAPDPTDSDPNADDDSDNSVDPELLYLIKPSSRATYETPNPASLPYPENWQGPRPPSRRQIERLEKRNRYLETRTKNKNTPPPPKTTEVAAPPKNAAPPANAVVSPETTEGSLPLRPSENATPLLANVAATPRTTEVAPPTAGEIPEFIPPPPRNVSTSDVPFFKPPTGRSPAPPKEKNPTPAAAAPSRRRPPAKPRRKKTPPSPHES
ncbi:MAG: hypothetical protein LBS59_01500 [Puniceicoccales bacterium]|nr:hypothetical protein [Puniceicoccales bacterium]